MTRIKAGVSADVETRLKKGKCLEELLKQDENKPVVMEDQVLLLFAFEHGFFEKVEPADVKDRMANWLDHIHSQ